MDTSVRQVPGVLSWRHRLWKLRVKLMTGAMKPRQVEHASVNVLLRVVAAAAVRQQVQRQSHTYRCLILECGYITTDSCLCCSSYCWCYKPPRCLLPQQQQRCQRQQVLTLPLLPLEETCFNKSYALEVYDLCVVRGRGPLTYSKAAAITQVCVLYTSCSFRSCIIHPLRVCACCCGSLADKSNMVTSVVCDDIGELRYKLEQHFLFHPADKEQFLEGVLRAGIH